jgi:hypothetical protein
MTRNREPGGKVVKYRYRAPAKPSARQILAPGTRTVVSNQLT